MSAGHSKHSKSGRERIERLGLRRPSATIPTRPVVMIVCDDTKTAPAYFTALSRRVRGSVTIDVTPAPKHGAKPNDMIRFAHQQISAENEPASESEGSAADSSESGDRGGIWTLIDMESEPAAHSEALDAKRASEGTRVRVALSKPCFEVWTLSHFVDTGTAFACCGEVLARVEDEWKKGLGSEMGPKAQADYSKLADRVGVAIDRARRHREAEDPSWTEVYLIVEFILSFLK